MRTELPYLAAGGVAIAGGMAEAKAWPPSGTRAVLATLVMVIVASATNNTAIAPLVRALGFLVLLGAIMAAVPVLAANQTRSK